MLDGFDKLADGTGKILESIPELYDDAIKPSAQEWGKTAALIPQTINAALVPLRQWIAQREYNIAETEKLIAEKMANVSIEKIITPEPYVAIPAIQAISYCMNNEDLRNLYANLLSKSMNIDTKNSVHPAFVEIIKQLSPTDTYIFNSAYTCEITPLINFEIKFPKEDGGGTKPAFRNLSWITKYSFEKVCISIDNLSRLKLISISDQWYTHDEHYMLVKNCSAYKVCHSALINALKPGQEIKEIKKILDVTDFGKQFYKICAI
ncbi:MAG: DUF4393 domain-containing protein [Hungatella sp.]|nr:DUF4393 domain-containing protein [Hungatella sp.]